MASVHHISVVEVVSEPAALRCIRIPRMDRKKTMTYYISPARYAISFSERRYRSRNSINEALKLGRTPPFIYAVLSFPRHIHPDTRTYKVNPDTIEQPKIHLVAHDRLFPSFPLPFRKPGSALKVNMMLSAYEESVYFWGMCSIQGRNSTREVPRPAACDVHCILLSICSMALSCSDGSDG